LPIVGHKVETVSPTRRDQLALNSSRWRMALDFRYLSWLVSRTDGIVTALIDGRSDPASLATRHDDFCNFESGIVAQPKLLEFALLVQLVDALKRPFKGYTPIRCMQVEDVDVVCLELLQRFLKILS
jgi:hypothetical protein